MSIKFHTKSSKAVNQSVSFQVNHFSDLLPMIELCNISICYIYHCHHHHPHVLIVLIILFCIHIVQVREPLDLLYLRVVQVSYLKIAEKSGYLAPLWERYIIVAGEY